MPRPTAQDLVISRLQGEIRSRDAHIQALERQIERLKNVLLEMCERYDIPEPDFRYGHYMPKGLELDLCPVEDEPVVESDLTDSLISEMIMNIGKPGRRYSVEMKKFCSLIYLRSPVAYETIMQVLPVPHCLTITRFLKFPISSVSMGLESFDGAREKLRSLKEEFSPNERILCTISVDACSHSDYIPGVGAPNEGLSLAKTVQLEEFCTRFAQPAVELEPPEVHKYCFLFYLQPLTRGIPCIPLYIQSSKTGKAGKQQTSALFLLAQIARSEGYAVAMLCSDGDNEYYSHQQDSYQAVKGVCCELTDCAGLGRQILGGLTLFGSDMLHLLKNARTRLLSPRVSMNIRNPQSLNLAEMINVLQLPVVCFRDSPLNKMMDALPLLIFTFENARSLFQAGLLPEAMYVLIFAMFQAFFRAKCNYAVRVGLGITLLRTLNRYITYMDQTTKNKTSRCLEYHRAMAHVTMFPKVHMERMSVTVATVLGLLLALPDGVQISLNRCSTHPLENFFGLLRTTCNFKHTYSNIENKIARTQVIRRFREDLGLQSPIRTRVSIAGEEVAVEKVGVTFVDTDFSLGILGVIDGSYAETELDLPAQPEVHEVIYRFICALSEIELPSAKVGGKYSGMQILNRLITNSRQ